MWASRTTRVERYARYCPVVVGLLTQPVGAQPILHENFDVTSERQRTRSSALPEQAERTGQAPASGGAGAAAGVTGSSGIYAPLLESDGYPLDGNTSRPHSVAYDDPFVPSIPVFKRLFAYNVVGPEFNLVIHPDTPHTQLKLLPIGGKPEPLEDQFQAAFDVTVPADGMLIRIPSVGPRTRILGARLTPDAPFRVRVDAAENWFLEIDRPGLFHLSMHLSMHRAAFDAGFEQTIWSEIVPLVPQLPPEVRRAAEQVLVELDVSRAMMSPQEAVRRLVGYFRKFEAYAEEQQGQGAELYQSIALGGRGVCRHRSFAFVVSALALGVPARLIRNEAHAWVELYDGRFWRRVDLGGAAGSLDMTAALDQRYLSPEDPYAWPLRSESAQSAVLRELSGAGVLGTSETDRGRSDSNTDQDRSPSAAPFLAPNSSSQAGVPRIVTSETERTTLTVAYRVQSATRGSRVELRGTASSLSGEKCSLLRVDISLQAESGRLYRLGSLVTDDAGEFVGQLTVPDTIPVGEYRVYAGSPGDLRCGAGAVVSD